MFSSSQQSGFISIFYSVGSNPLALWDKQVKNGHIRRVIDDEVKSLVLDVGGTNVATTYITCPIKPRASLGIKLPYLVMVIKNMKKYFSFEIQILDDKDMRRRFRVSNFQSTTKVRPFCTTMPIGLSSGWNQVQFNLADFTKRAYGSVYLETVRVQIHANVRIRRIYFTDQLHSDEDLPNEFKLFAPGPKGKGKDKKSSKEALEAAQGEVPPIKTDLKPDEEMPPPPTPAEESPVAQEDAPDGAPADTETELAGEGGEAVEGEAPPPAEGAEGEAPPPAEEGAEGPKPEGGEGAQPAEGEGAPPPEGEAPAEGPPAEEGAEPAAGEPAPEGEAAPAEGEMQPPAEGAEGEIPAGAEEAAAAPEPAVEGDAPPEAVQAEAVATEPVEEAAEVPAEVTTEATSEVTETATEGSPSEPATTDNEGEA